MNGMHNSMHSDNSSNFLAAQHFKARQNAGRLHFAVPFSLPAEDWWKGAPASAVDTFSSAARADLLSCLSTRCWCYGVSPCNQRGKASVHLLRCKWVSSIHQPSNKATAERLVKHLNWCTAYGGEDSRVLSKNELNKTQKKERKLGI